MLDGDWIANGRGRGGDLGTLIRSCFGRLRADGVA